MLRMRLLAPVPGTAYIEQCECGYSHKPFLRLWLWAVRTGAVPNPPNLPPRPGIFIPTGGICLGLFKFAFTPGYPIRCHPKFPGPPQVSCRMTGWGGKSWAAPGRTTAQCPPHMPPLRPLPAVIPGGAPEAPQCPPRNPGAMGFSDFYERPCNTPMIGNTLERY